MPLPIRTMLEFRRNGISAATNSSAQPTAAKAAADAAGTNDRQKAAKKQWINMACPLSMRYE